MQKSASRLVEITVLSAEGLCINGNWVKDKDKPFAIVKVDVYNYHATKVDVHGGSYPSWDEKLEIDMPCNARSMTLEVQCRSRSGDRMIGAANLPVTDFTGGYVPEDYLRFLSYMLRDSRGNKTGIINVSVRLKAPENPCSSCSLQGKLKVAGYDNHSQQKMGIPVGENNYHEGTVTGVRVWSLNLASFFIFYVIFFILFL